MIEDREMWDRHWGKGAFHNENHRALINTCEALAEGNLSGLAVLEVGSGRGVDSVALALLGATVCMVDYSKPSFDLSTSLAAKKGVAVNPTLADAVSLPFRDEAFDIVFSQGVMEHSSNIQLLAEQARVTKTGGYVIVDVPQLYSLQAINKAIQIMLGKWPYGKEESFSKRRVEQLLEQAGLKPVAAYGWGILPIMHMGIRTLFKKHVTPGHSSIPNASTNSHGTLIDMFDRIERSPIAPWIMNNIGVVGQK